MLPCPYKWGSQQAAQEEASRRLVGWSRRDGSVGKDPLRDFVETIKKRDVARGNLRGLLHILVGRRITRADGTLVSTGMTWRELAAELKRLRWDRAGIQELGLDPATLPPRDRVRFWYSAIALAGLDTAEAVTAGDRLLPPCRALGYLIGPAPGGK